MSELMQNEFNTYLPPDWISFDERELKAMLVPGTAQMSIKAYSE